MISKEVKYYGRILKNILKDPKINGLLESLSQHMQLRFMVTFADGNLLWGEDLDYEHVFELEENEVSFGSVGADQARGQVITDLLMTLIRKDLQKMKKIGIK